MLQVRGNTLQHVEKLKYLGGIYEWRKAERQEIDTRIGKANAALRELYCSVDKKELPNTAKLSVFISVFVLILIYGYGHEYGVMTERILTQVQAPKMGFLRRIHGVTKVCTEVRCRPGQETSSAPPYLNLRCFGSKCIALKKKFTTLLRLFGGAPNDWAPGALRPLCYAPGVTLRDKVRSCEIRRALNVEPLLLIERTQLKLVGSCIRLPGAFCKNTGHFDLSTVPDLSCVAAQGKQSDIQYC